MSEAMRWNRRILDFSKKTYIMGILNCTPDSFYPASRHPGTEDAVSLALHMADSGVDIIDVGGESTRPGSADVAAEEEISRICPVIDKIRLTSDVLISVDTRSAEVAQRALTSGADIVNDISGLKADPAMQNLVADEGVPVIIMHIRGTPQTMQANPYYTDAICEIKAELLESVDLALRAGVQKRYIVLDPGIGFGKRLEDNVNIIRNLAKWRELGYPLLVGVSRKSFLGQILDLPVDERLIGTVTANTIAVLNGANIVRVHDYCEAIQMVRVVDAVMKN